jgi:hypothetical protein
MRGLLFTALVTILAANMSQAQESAAFQPENPKAISLPEAPGSPGANSFVEVPESPNTTSFVGAPPEKRQKLAAEGSRLFRIFPTNTVTNIESAAPLTTRGKWRLFVKDKTDPCTLGWVVFNAGLMQANNDFPEYGHGASGFAKRFGAATADDTAAGFFGTFLFPSLLHQDPRYHRMGTGPFKKRLGHALIRPILTQKDSGGLAFNWSGVLASVAASSLSNAYYPERNRGAGPTFSRVGTGIPFSMIDQLVNEFGPDLQRKVFRRNREKIAEGLQK